MPTPAKPADPDTAKQREAFYDEVAGQNLAPLWLRLKGMVTPEPRPQLQPFGWRYADIRPTLMKAGELLSTEEAERRVLILENPGFKGTSNMTASMFAGLQLLMPGERARAHRHVASALRFIIEGACAYTAVDGERTLMHPGDFVLTPSWTWHDHGNEGDVPVVWLDGLDIPMVNLFDASFAEEYSETTYPLTRPMGESERLYTGAMLPEDDRPVGPYSPLINYRYARARESLAALAKAAAPDPSHGYKLRYVHPQTGGSPLPTISAALQLLPKGVETAPYRSTDSTVFACAEGQGRSIIGDFAFDWTPRDIFVVPSWMPVTHRATDESVLFSYSDRAAQERLGLWREKRDRQNAP